MVRTEGVEPSPHFQDQILSLARLPFPPRSHLAGGIVAQLPAHCAESTLDMERAPT